MSEKSKEKEIRFIDSHYKDLFQIPDGGYIQLERSNGETVSKKCSFIDEYHTQVGTNVFHICEFAERMEDNGTKYLPEPEIVEEQVAWKVGRSHYLAIQTCDDGYDFTLYDDKWCEIDGGQLDNPEMSMLEIRNEILKDFKLEKRDLEETDYDEVVDTAMELEIQNVREQTIGTNMGKMPIEDYREIAAMQNGFDSYEDMRSQGVYIDMGEHKEVDPIAELAGKLDRYAENFDTYEYRDSVEDSSSNIESIKADLKAGNVESYRNYLKEMIVESREETAVEVGRDTAKGFGENSTRKETICYG